VLCQQPVAELYTHDGYACIMACQVQLLASSVRVAAQYHTSSECELELFYSSLCSPPTVPSMSWRLSKLGRCSETLQADIEANVTPDGNQDAASLPCCASQSNSRALPGRANCWEHGDCCFADGYTIGLSPCSQVMALSIVIGRFVLNKAPADDSH
jgi:hypothetical protein